MNANYNNIIQAILDRNLDLVYRTTSKIPHDHLIEFNNFYFDTLPRLNLNPDDLLVLAIFPRTHSWFSQTQYNLVKQAIDAGANIHTTVFIEGADKYPIEITTDPQIFALLQMHGGKCFSELYRFQKHMLELVEKTNQKLTEKSQESLERIASKTLASHKEPLIHYVWIPNLKKKTADIGQENLNSAITTKHEIETESSIKWKFIAWSINWYSILESGRVLSDAGFLLKNISEITPIPSIFYYIPTLQEANLVGVAKDIVVYTVKILQDGVFLDFDIRVKPKIMDDFFLHTDWASSALNGAFMSKANHPFMSAILETVEKSLQDHYIQALMHAPKHASFDNALMIIALVGLISFQIGIFKAAETQNTLDFIYAPCHDNNEFDNCNVTFKCHKPDMEFSRLVFGEERNIGSGFSYIHTEEN